MNFVFILSLFHFLTFLPSGYCFSFDIFSSLPWIIQARAHAVSNQAKNGWNVPADSRLTHALFIQLQEFKPTIQFLLLTTDFCTGSYFSHRGKEFLNLRWVGLRGRLTSDCKSLPFHKIFGRLKKLPPLSCTAIHNIRSCTEYPCCTHIIVLYIPNFYLYRNCFVSVSYLFCISIVFVLNP